MGKVKKTLKKFGRQVWELFKSSIPASLMYFCAGTVLMMLTMKDVSDLTKLEWNNTALILTIVCIVVAAAYDGLVTFAQGGNAYEMLVSGNLKRVSANDFGEGYKISSHKEAKEYRAWKGFVAGGLVAIFPLVLGIIFGCNQAQIDAIFTATAQGQNIGLGVLLIVGLLLSGWSLVPLVLLNASGASVSYFLSLIFILIPIVVTGVMYIVGAYAKRNKTIRQQQLADRAAAAQEIKEKKVNYGGLPGTKPKKRK